jgi:hypothetical protein
MENGSGSGIHSATSKSPKMAPVETYGSVIVKFTVVLLNAAPDVTAGGVTGVTGKGQSGSM